MRKHVDHQKTKQSSRTFAGILIGAGLLLGLLGTGTAAQAGTTVRLADCSYAGQGLNIADLSTTSVANTVDPHWSVKYGSTILSGAPGHTALSAWTALPSNWVQPSAPTATAVDENVGDYTYTLSFFIPCNPANYSVLELDGAVAADNEITSVSVNGGPSIASCSGNCFNTPAGGTPFTVTALQLLPGLNTLEIVVHNDSIYSGMSVIASLKARCGKNCCRILPPRKGIESPPAE